MSISSILGGVLWLVEIHPGSTFVEALKQYACFTKFLARYVSTTTALAYSGYLALGLRTEMHILAGVDDI